MAVQDRPQNAFLVGRVAARFIIVDGPAGTSAAFSPAEIGRLRAINQRALSILSLLAAAQPTRVPLIWGSHTTAINVEAPLLPFNPNPTQADPKEPREQPWRDEALVALVGQTGVAGLRALHAASVGGADHCVIVFWTNYECSWHAYSVDAHAKAVMCAPMFAPSRPGGSLSVAPRLVAHEIGHLFGAPDEYRGSACKVLGSGGGGFGRLDFPNFNCEVINPNSVPCLMSHNDELICDASSLRVGRQPANWRSGRLRDPGSLLMSRVLALTDSAETRDAVIAALDAAGTVGLCAWASASCPPKASTPAAWRSCPALYRQSTTPPVVRSVMSAY